MLSVYLEVRPLPTSFYPIILIPLKLFCTTHTSVSLLYSVKEKEL